MESRDVAACVALLPTAGYSCTAGVCPTATLVATSRKSTLTSKVIDCIVLMLKCCLAVSLGSYFPRSNTTVMELSVQLINNLTHLSIHVF